MLAQDRVPPRQRFDHTRSAKAGDPFTATVSQM